MSLRINTNVAALNAYNNLATNQANQASSFERLSSGLRINKAADDAAGLSISQGLTSQINGMTQAVSNAQDGINVAQIADGALGTTQNILQRMRTLAVQANNTGSMDANAVSAAQAELGNLNKELDSISSSTAFGGSPLLDLTTGNKGVFQFQVGANDSTGVGGASNQLSLDLSTTGALAGATITAYDSTGLKTSGLNLSTGAGAAITAIDAAIKDVSTARSYIGATQNQLNYTVSNLQTSITNVTASRSNLTDADLASEVTKMTQSQILSQAATSVLAQANSAPQAILKLLQ
ncbi:MAG TPA: flagellin [Jatrophihabitans sp.]|jgi:flagellin|uniref:flagellin N-terminal helical domain-containing protein n=1 Tax=Jatrophihabitans sp. TaxID=1932789 RepID=UPI002DFBB84E|nr:flagellin [Jatrophihabitans sp.]